MPCTIYEDRAKTIVEPSRNSLDKIKVKNLEACLCAVLRELNRRNLLTDILESSSIKGKVDVQSWWEEHRKADINRISKVIADFSEDDKELTHITDEEVIKHLNTTSRYT